MFYVVNVFLFINGHIGLKSRHNRMYSFMLMPLKASFSMCWIFGPNELCFMNIHDMNRLIIRSIKEAFIKSQLVNTSWRVCKNTNQPEVNVKQLQKMAVVI